MGVVHAGIPRPGKLNYLLGNPRWRRIHRTTAPVSVSEDSRSVLPVCCEHPPCMTFTDTKNRRCFAGSQLPLQYPIQRFQSCLFLLAQRQSFHRTDIFARQLATDRFACQQLTFTRESGPRIMSRPLGLGLPSEAGDVV